MADERSGKLQKMLNKENEKKNNPMDDVDKLLKKQLEKERIEQKRKEEQEKK